MQITPEEIAETLAMVGKQHLDIRTITLGLNLRGCTHEEVDVIARKVYDRLTTAAEKLVPTADQLEREYGVPIVNKRISVTPIAEICAATTTNDLSPLRAPWIKQRLKLVLISSVASRRSCTKALRQLITS